MAIHVRGNRQSKSGALLLCVSVLWLASGSPAKAIDLQSGQWEVSTKRERDRAVTERPTRTTCITADKATQLTQRVSKALPTEQSPGRGTTCKIVDRKATDKEVTWHAKCSGLFEGDQDGHYVIDSPQHVTTTIHTTIRSSLSGNQKTLSSTLTTEARRIGECPK